jgi:predicted unusual protein kinase regulating ubiquinone biosynthesis (AarF/ABC1/UbiB family)
MTTLLSPGKLKRYGEIAWLLFRHGRPDLGRRIGIAAEAPESAAAESDARDLARDLEKLGPTFIKVGQLLSTRADWLPQAYVDALARLQDRVEPFSFGEVERIVQEELNVRISKAFLEFDVTPLAAASLGQVHRALLRDGRPVAVKVQRPGIPDRIAEDLEVFAEIARLLDRHSDLGGIFDLERMIDEFRKTLLAELDYRQEARNLRVLHRNLREFQRIVVPAPVEDYSAHRILTMEFVSGRKITGLSPLSRMELEGEALAGELFEAYLRQILVDGFFHADPHPGNVFVTEDGRLALIDLGMVARLPDPMQETLLKLLLAISDGRSDEVAELSAAIGEKQETFDPAALRRRVSDLVAGLELSSMSQLRVGRALSDLSRASAEAGIRLPSELTLLGKALLHLDEIGRVLAPDFDPNAAVQRHAADLLRRRIWRSATPGRLAAAALEAKEFVEKLPVRVNRVLDLVANNELKIRVDAIDERLLIEGLHKIANRIALGVILAALILGSAMLVQVPTRFRILGYPGLAMLFFLSAALGALLLVVSILRGDRKKPRARPPTEV